MRTQVLHICCLLLLLLQKVFQITPLSLVEWMAVLKLSFPVILLDETLKLAARGRVMHHLHWVPVIWLIYFAALYYSPI